MSAQNLKKLTPYPVSALAQPPSPLSMQTHHKFWKIEVFAQKSTDVRIWRPPSECGSLLQTALKHYVALVHSRQIEQGIKWNGYLIAL